ncbi:MAG: VTT domain-containing protein [Planctomycetota bacterium]
MRPRHVLRVLLLVVLIGAMVAAFVQLPWLREPGAVDRIRDEVRALGWIAPVAFVLIYAVAMVLCLPATPLSLAAGGVFGWAGAVAANLVGSTLGATAAFLVARALGAPGVQRLFGTRGRRLIEGVEAEGWRFVVFVRLVVIIPFNVSNYLFGITRLRVGTYALATAVGMLPGCVAYSYLGHAIAEALADRKGAVDAGLVALMLLVVAAVLPRWLLTRRVMRIDLAGLAAASGGGDRPMLLLDLRETSDAAATPIGIATHIPASQLAARIGELGPPADRAVIMITNHGGFAVRTVRTLRAAGFRIISVFSGGASELHAGLTES